MAPHKSSSYLRSGWYQTQRLALKQVSTLSAFRHHLPQRSVRPRRQPSRVGVWRPRGRRRIQRPSLADDADAHEPTRPAFLHASRPLQRPRRGREGSPAAVSDRPSRRGNAQTSARDFLGSASARNGRAIRAWSVPGTPTASRARRFRGRWDMVPGPTPGS